MLEPGYAVVLEQFFTLKEDDGTRPPAMRSWVSLKESASYVQVLVNADSKGVSKTTANAYLIKMQML